VPLLNASLTDCVFEMERPTTVEEVTSFFARWSEGRLADILGFETRPLVSVYFLGMPDRRLSTASRPWSSTAPR
jgi:glyceraldehyde 3-phosphate dehydrogenase